MTSDITVAITAQPAITVGVSPLGAAGTSAYQLAVAGGFVGTEAEWLASLQGPDGPTAVSADVGNAAVLGTDNLIYVPDSGGGGASNWGDLGGTLSDQEDLQAALDAKADTSDLGTAASHPATDFATAAQGAKADTALQSAPVTSVNSKTGAVSLTASDVGASPTGAYVKPGPGIPSTDMAAAVQTSLGKADTALQSAPVASVAGKTGAVSLVESDIANLVPDLAAKAPSAAGVPTGGTTGQVLKKNSGTDYDTVWGADLSIAIGSANNPHTSASDARNSSLPKNFWQCSTTPTNWVDGDEWIVK